MGITACVRLTVPCALDALLGVAAQSSCPLPLVPFLALPCCLAEICNIWSDLNVDFLSFGAVLFVIAQTMFLGA